jgi:uncharacterized membrane protein YsdA (DUF1294 family)/cold shock CspA family protein
VRYKGKLIKWNSDKAFGFILPNGGGANVFMHKTALCNRQRTPQINDIITFSISKDKNGKVCASDATFSGEKLKSKAANKAPQKNSTFSIYLSFLFLAAITGAYVMNQFPQKLLFVYFCFSVITFFVYAFDKSKAQRGAWRIQESTLHMFALIGGWPGAAMAQQLLRHKSKKQKFRTVYWITVIINIGGLLWLYLSSGGEYVTFLY